MDSNQTPKALSFDTLDGLNLNLLDDHGTTYCLAVNDALRAAVRQAGSPSGQTVSEIPKQLRPKDIQALIRSGATPEELASRSGMTLASISRYAQPVLDERAFVVDRAQDLPVRHDDSGPRLGDVVVNRLAAQQVDTTNLQWDARREHGRWTVLVAFVTANGPATARWMVDLTVGKLSAVNEEAAWITENDLGGPLRPLPPRGLVPIPGGNNNPNGHGRSPNKTASPPASQDRSDATAPWQPGRDWSGVDPGLTSDLGPHLTLLDDLMASRGLRRPPVASPVDLPPTADRPTPLPQPHGEVLSLVRSAEPVETETAATDQSESAEEAPVSSNSRRPRRSIHERANSLQPTVPLERGTVAGSALEEDASVAIESAQSAKPNHRALFDVSDNLNAAPGEPAGPTAVPLSDATTVIEPQELRRALAETDSANNPPAPQTKQQPAPKTASPAKTPRAKARRSSVPSWDEIVFGAKPDQR
ncbi:MAG: DUF3071 domain-containing protein [Bifidobacteriaceae bacterium]|nr:DUF3071 domain-containing protein [Bifidobacteriaceae bacterium]